MMTLNHCVLLKGREEDGGNRQGTNDMYNRWIVARATYMHCLCAMLYELQKYHEQFKMQAVANSMHLGWGFILELGCHYGPFLRHTNIPNPDTDDHMQQLVSGLPSVGNLFVISIYLIIHSQRLREKATSTRIIILTEGQQAWLFDYNDRRFLTSLLLVCHSTGHKIPCS